MRTNGLKSDQRQLEYGDQLDPTARDYVQKTVDGVKRITDQYLQMASLTAATYRSLCLSTAANVVHVLRGEPPEPRSVFR